MKINKKLLFLLPIIGVASVITPVVLTSCEPKVYIILDTMDPKIKNHPNTIRIRAALTNGYVYPKFEWKWKLYHHDWGTLPEGMTKDSIVYGPNPDFIPDDPYYEHWHIDIDPTGTKGNFKMLIQCWDVEHTKRKDHITVYFPPLN